MTDIKSLSRRQMLAAGAVGVAGLWAVDAPALTRRMLARVAPAKTPGPSATAPLATTGAAAAEGDARWAASVGSQFFLDGPAGTVAMTLTAVTPLAGGGTRPREVARKQAFTLLFDTGAVAAPAAERIYTVYGREIGTAALFLTPSALKPNGLVAVFN